ncbi:hypothetical protein SJDPG12_06585 [Porphyromonas gingivalis SJD12]|nr:hypothetical protein SJDPG12_06585 [Porphyromonas gingivalis SJD12]
MKGREEAKRYDALAKKFMPLPPGSESFERAIEGCCRSQFTQISIRL